MHKELPLAFTRRALVALMAMFLASLCAAATQPADTLTSRPNILWISCEDISPDLGCYGDAQASTPNLDRLAAQGTRYTNAFAFAPVCAPSRSTIITGMYATSIGTMHMRSKGVPPSFVKCFPEYLRAAGYYCTNNAKTDYNFDCPPSAWDECSKRAHWRNRPKDKPFFSVFNLVITHEGKFHMGDQEIAELTSDLKPGQRHDPAKAKLPPYYPDTPLVRKDWARYEDMISEMDFQAGQILKQLEQDGLAENTIVFFFSDHGRGLPRGKRWVYDSGLRVPLLVRWPGKIKPASTSEELVSFVDLAPTILSLAGVEVPSHMQGQPFLGREGVTPRSYIFGMRNRMDETYDTIRCVRDKRFKYIRNYEPEKPYAQRIAYGEKTATLKEMRRLNAEGQLTGPQTLFFRPRKPAEELYDVSADPHEVSDLAQKEEFRPVLERMRKALDEWTSKTGDLGLIPEDKLKERMRPGGKWEVTSSPVFTPEGGVLHGPTPVEIHCPTEGASIVYRTEGQRRGWKLYSAPVLVDHDTTITAIASRLGWRDSAEAAGVFVVRAK